jgi:hypothetical protein
VLAAVQVDDRGIEHAVGLREAATENAAAVRARLGELVERGLDINRSLLVVIDGAKALHKAECEVGFRGVGCVWRERATDAQSDQRRPNRRPAAGGFRRWTTVRFARRPADTGPMIAIDLSLLTFFQTARRSWPSFAA